jgi:hypothetical protein
MRSIDFGNKSFNTKIQITKDGDFFEIYIPPIGFCPGFLCVTLFTIFWNCYATGGLFSAAQGHFPPRGIFSAAQGHFLFPVIISILFLPFCAQGVLLIYACLFILFGKTYFRINRHELCLIKNLFGWKVSRQCPKRKITEIIFKRNSFYADSGVHINNFVEAIAGPKFKIGTHSIELGALRSGINHDTEVEWLAYEISEWLDKPLTIIDAPLKKLKGNFK